MPSLASTARADNLARLNEERFDVLVIGGGVTGAGVALDAAARGYKVALVEKTDFASGTSSKSTKLVHGGLRYLSTFDFALVREALTERGILLRIAPYLVQPVPFVLPMYEGDRHPAGLPFTTPRGTGLGVVMNVGLWFYDLLAGRLMVQRHRHLSRACVHQLAPALVTNGLREGFVYYDAQTNDARLTMALIRTAAQYGATIANYAEVTSFVIEQGRAVGAQVQDRLNDRHVTVHARHIVNATGVFSEDVEALTGTTPHVQVEPSKGVHLVLSRQDLRLGESAIVLPETDDGRILFIVPWETRAIYGTTDTGSGDLDHPAANREDIAYLLDHLNRYLSVSLSAEDIISTYAGYRPLLKPRAHAPRSSAKLSRTHAVLESPAGVVTIAGGKLTTYRRMAQDTVDVLNKRDGSPPVHSTMHIPLHGSVGWPAVKRELETEGKALGLREQTIAHLGKSYGSEGLVVLSLVQSDPSLAQVLIGDLPYIKAEVIYACGHEMAMTPCDVLARRTAITLLDRRRGMGVVDDVAALMARELGWSPAEQQRMVDAFSAAMHAQIVAEKSP